MNILLNDPKAILLRAAELIEERGFHKGSYTNCLGNLCTYGAIGMAISGDPGYAGGSGEEEGQGYYHPACQILRSALEEDRGEESISIWNDMPERTQEEVVNLLREVAESL